MTSYVVVGGVIVGVLRGLSTFHYYLNRLLDVPLNKEEYITELNVIKQLAVNNGYEIDFIQRLLQKLKLKRVKTKAYPPKNLPQKRYTSLLYISNHLNNKISKTIYNHSQNTHISHKPNDTLQHQLVNNKDSLKKLEKSGIYKLTNMC